MFNATFSGAWLTTFGNLTIIVDPRCITTVFGSFTFRFVLFFITFLLNDWLDSKFHPGFLIDFRLLLLLLLCHLNIPERWHLYAFRWLWLFHLLCYLFSDVITCWSIEFWVFDVLDWVDSLEDVDIESVWSVQGTNLTMVFLSLAYSDADGNEAYEKPTCKYDNEGIHVEFLLLKAKPVGWLLAVYLSHSVAAAKRV